MFNTRRFGKTAVSMCACAISLLLFTATSRDSYIVVDRQERNETIALDSDGNAKGVLSVRFDAKNIPMFDDSPTLTLLDGRFLVSGEDARKSLKVLESNVDETESKVRDVYRVYRDVSDCWEDEEPEEVVDCTFSVALEFSGKKDAEEPVTFAVEFGDIDSYAMEYEMTIHELSWVVDTE